MTEQEQMNELIDKVHQWGVDRKIIGNGKLETQWLKLLSEFGEMCDTLAKGGDPIDDIGDQLVVLIMMAGIKGKVDAVKEMTPSLPFGERDNISAVRRLAMVANCFSLASSTAQSRRALMSFASLLPITTSPSCNACSTPTTRSKTAKAISTNKAFSSRSNTMTCKGKKKGGKGK